ncbi:hypothetical protein JCM11491_005661 [Sporobolomyces phaffii]
MSPRDLPPYGRHEQHEKVDDSSSHLSTAERYVQAFATRVEPLPLDDRLTAEDKSALEPYARMRRHLAETLGVVQHRLDATRERLTDIIDATERTIAERADLLEWQSQILGAFEQPDEHDPIFTYAYEQNWTAISNLLGAIARYAQGAGVRGLGRWTRPRSAEKILTKWSAERVRAALESKFLSSIGARREILWHAFEEAAAHAEIEGRDLQHAGMGGRNSPDPVQTWLESIKRATLEDEWKPITDGNDSLPQSYKVDRFLKTLLELPVPNFYPPRDHHPGVLRSGSFPPPYSTATACSLGVTHRQLLIHRLGA